MQRIKLVSPFLVLVVMYSVFFSSGCLDPAGPIEATMTVRFPDEYLLFCNEFFDDSETVRVTWFVDAIDANGNLTIFRMDGEELGNDDLNPNDLNFEIEVPESGSYVVTIECNITCATCCSELRNTDNDIPCNETGLPTFRVPEITINQPSSISFIEAVPEFVDCFECGCDD